MRKLRESGSTRTHAPNTQTPNSTKNLEEGAEPADEKDYSWCCCTSNCVKKMGKKLKEDKSANISYAFIVRETRLLENNDCAATTLARPMRTNRD